ncbi:MAG: hypothetical protein H6Q30_1597 [Bacteroidetes bacterium]|jgi:hypothetical protein|nr:hypothetical protein [Bacteroidota bacterium]
MGVLLIALSVEKSFAMPGSILGTWVPFARIFLSTYITGLSVENTEKEKAVALGS